VSERDVEEVSEKYSKGEATVLIGVHKGGQGGHSAPSEKEAAAAAKSKRDDPDQAIAPHIEDGCSDAQFDMLVRIGLIGPGGRPEDVPASVANEAFRSFLMGKRNNKS
jgi:hypothetical protein